MAEQNDDIFQLAKDLAKADKELKIEPWVRIDIGYTSPDRSMVYLHSYDLPREVWSRRKWVINWRIAKLQCQHPRLELKTWYGFYDKRSGLSTEAGSDLSKLRSAKAQVTRVERAIKAYIEANRNSLFFDEATDENLLKARAKLQTKIEGVRLAEQRLEALVKKHNNNEL